MDTIAGEWIMKGCRRTDPGCLHSPEDLLALVRKAGFLVDVVGIEHALVLQERLPIPDVVQVHEVGERGNGAPDIARNVVHGVGAAGAHAVHVVEVDALLEQLRYDRARIRRAHAPAFEQERGLEHVAFQRIGHSGHYTGRFGHGAERVTAFNVAVLFNAKWRLRLAA